MNKGNGQPSSKQAISWPEIREKALGNFINYLANLPILAYPKYDQAYVLYADHVRKMLMQILLSRLPLDFEHYLKTCIKSVSQDVIQVTASAARSQYNNEIIWVSALSTIEHTFTLQNSVKMHHVSGVRLNSNDISQVQRPDYYLSRVLRSKEKGQKPNRQRLVQKPGRTKILLREWDKLYVRKDGTSLRKTSEYDSGKVSIYCLP